MWDKLQGKSGKTSFELKDLFVLWDKSDCTCISLHLTWFRMWKISLNAHSGDSLFANISGLCPCFDTLLILQQTIFNALRWTKIASFRRILFTLLLQVDFPPSTERVGGKRTPRAVTAGKTRLPRHIQIAIRDWRRKQFRKYCQIYSFPKKNVLLFGFRSCM